MARTYHNWLDYSDNSSSRWWNDGYSWGWRRHRHHHHHRRWDWDNYYYDGYYWD